MIVYLSTIKTPKTNHSLGTNFSLLLQHTFFIYEFSMQPKSFLKTLGLLHIALCAGIGLFAAFVILQSEGFKVASDQSSPFIYIVPLIAMLGYFGNTFIYKNLIQNLPREEDLRKKLQRYQIANIIKYALIEGPAFLALGIYYIEQNALYLVIAICLLIYLIVQKPSFEKLKNELKLSLEDEKEFDTLNG